MKKKKTRNISAKFPEPKYPAPYTPTTVIMQAANSVF